MRQARPSALASASAAWLLGLLGACGARTDVPAGPSESGGLAPASTAPGGDVPVHYDSPQDACMASDGPGHAYASEADLQSLLAGRWMMCNPGTPNAYWSAEGVGLDLLASGLAYPLYRRNDGQISVEAATTCGAMPSPPAETGSTWSSRAAATPRSTRSCKTHPRKLVMNDGKKLYTFAPAQ